MFDVGRRGVPGDLRGPNREDPLPADLREEFHVEARVECSGNWGGFCGGCDLPIYDKDKRGETAGK